MATETVNFASVQNQIKKKVLAPVYLLHGEEGYFIDQLLADAEQIIPEGDRDFNLYTLYAPQIDADTVMDTCRRYPMMTDRQVVIVKEVQAGGARFLKGLTAYLEAPTSTTVLFLAHRGEEYKGAEVLKAIKKGGGVVFESKKLKDNMLAAAIEKFITNKGLSVDPKALIMLRDFVGNDLSRIFNEVNKLTVTLGQGAMVTPEAVERNIGVSKEYNNFEFVAAVACRDAEKAMTILDHFSHNPKGNPFTVISTILYNLFSSVLIAQYTPDKSERSLMAALGLKWSMQLKDISAAMRNYSPAQVVEILSEIKNYDNQSKGNGSRQDAYALLHALVYHILTATGKL